MQTDAAHPTTVEAVSEQSGLPPQFLNAVLSKEESGAGFLYRLEDGSAATKRILTRLDPRTYVWAGEPADSPFGLECVWEAAYSGEVVLGACEIDVLVGRYQDIPILSAPEYLEWDPEWNPYLDRASLIYIAVDLEFAWHSLLWQLAHSDFADGVRLLDLGPKNSITDLHVESPVDFESRLRRAMAKAVPLLETPYWQHRNHRRFP